MSNWYRLSRSFYIQKCQRGEPQGKSNPMKKLLLSLLFAIVAICTFAQSFEYDGIKYEVLDNSVKTCMVASYNSVSGNITIPSAVTYNGSQYTVTVIGWSAFENCSELTSIYLPKSLISIGSWAFSGCSSLNVMNIPSGVTNIDYEAFSGCKSLTEITLPNSLTSIADGAFEYCSNLISISLPDNLTSIGLMSFYGCLSLNEITIPEKLSSIGERAFTYCTSLMAINVVSENKYFTSIDGVLFTKDLSIIIQCPGGKSGKYSIPDGVISIGDYAFRGCIHLTEINVPEGITSSGFVAFSDCSNLITISLPESLTTIDSSSFSDCTSLTSISLPENLTYIGPWAFSNCTSLTAITLPASLTSFREQIFSGCSSLTSINVSSENQVLTSKDGVLFSKDLSILIMYPEGKTGEYIIPEGVTTITVYAFEKCLNLTSIIIPEGTTSILDYAFHGCSNLTLVNLPKTLESIGYAAFGDCSSLSTVNSYATTPPKCYNDDVFAGIPSDAILHVPVGTKDAYATAIGWSIFSNIIDDLNPIMGVEEIETPSKDADDSVMVYNLQGLRMDASNRSELPSLPSGIYIIEGRKVYVK